MLRRKSLSMLLGAVQRAVAERDYSLVRDPELAERAYRLVGTLRDERPDVESLFILAQFMWYRFRALGPKGRAERDIAFQLFARCLIHGDKPLPGSILPDVIPIAFDLAVDLLQRSATARKTPPADRVVEAWRRLERVTSDERPERAMVLANLRVALLLRFGVNKDGTDLDEAIALARQAVKVVAAGDPDPVRYLIHLGDTLQMRIERTEAASDVDEIIEVWREALRALPEDSPDRLKVLSQLGAALFMRLAHDEVEVEGDLDEAIALYLQAVRTTPANYPERDLHLSNLSTVLEIRAEATGDAAHKEAARAAREEAAKAMTAPRGDDDTGGMSDDPSGLHVSVMPAETDRERPWTDRPERPASATLPATKRLQPKRQSRRKRRSGS